MRRWKGRKDKRRKGRSKGGTNNTQKNAITSRYTLPGALYSWCSVPSNFLLYSPAQQPLYTLTWKRQSLFCTTEGFRNGVLLGLYTPALFLPSSCALLHTFISEPDCTPLQCFYKGYTQSNQQLAVSRLMHSTHCDSAIFPYQALERKQAQDTLSGCAGLYNKFEGVELCIRRPGGVGGGFPWFPFRDRSNVMQTFVVSYLCAQCRPTVLLSVTGWQVDGVGMVEIFATTTPT
jgi:hypothetical protein